jgi:alkyl sulfatase BDS1-like metallo-beta-lactamase superfamily hydrolase
MWDQTVRGINKGLTLGELTEAVQLPDLYADSYLQTQFYGVVEHHVRQIHAGLRGWFDGDEAALFPVPPVERATKLVDGFGGAQAVRNKIAEANESNDIRWAIEMATWLIRLESAGDDDRAQLADLLRVVARRTTAANIRNWCLVRARHLDGTADTDRFHAHRFSLAQVEQAPVSDVLATVRVMLNPMMCGDVDQQLTIEVSGDRAGLHVRRGVAVPTTGSHDGLQLSTSTALWAALMANKTGLTAILAAPETEVSNRDSVSEFLSWFEHRSFNQ